ncbi:MAG TPA: DNA polymerase III subunit alpha [Spirochaetota bacterium]|nr:DNA polymerase III subunit alpha [Spirochaetota bacterium]HOM38274.1 DNA polymerase III subunit alpha [Spirochaetota bacterium]HPQ48508.1 DNA polymerase III subunit alpha [Spirochaetota bacterium]
MENSASLVPFVHLHTHSEYSIGDSICRIDALFSKAKEYRMRAVALTDHGNLFGAAELFIKASNYKIKPIIGCELYLTSDISKKSRLDDENKYYHIIVFARNNEGYKNLVKIVSKSFIEGFYYKPRIDYKILEEYSKGLVASSACLAGEIPRLILSNRLAEAKKRALYYKELFGIDGFFLELMDHGITEQQVVNEMLIKISQDTSIPLIATNDVHYISKDDYRAHDVFLCIGSGKKLTDKKRKMYPTDQFYFKSYDEMKAKFENISLEAVHNTEKVANLCNFYPELGKFNLPSFDTGGISYKEYLYNLCYSSIEEKYKNSTINIDTVKSRLDYELSVISKMGFESYFLIVQDFINRSREMGVRVGPGRGSAAGSIVAYLTGITRIDPLKYGLLFERFLNPQRISMPDIDSDFSDDGREKVIEYIRNKYGSDKVANIITFGRLKARAVIRDVGRVLDIPLNEVDIIAKKISPNEPLKKSFEDIELKSIIESDSYKELSEYALKLEGIARNISTHAAGIVIGKESLDNIIPLYKDPNSGIIMTQFEGKFLEEFGLLKMDILGLKNLRIIDQTLKLVKENKNIEIDIDNIDLNDPKVYDLFREGKTIGIFQCESEGIRELMKRMEPSTFEDIIALIALYRPGPINSGMAEEFIKRKHDSSLLKYPHPSLESVLKDTYGVIVYQEQVMLISQIIANFSLAEADSLRKAMGKKNPEVMAKMKEKFIKGGLENNHKKDFLEDLFAQMEKFAEYGFNKSHSAAYSFITYQTAYLKTYYPLEYMTALLNSEVGGAIEDIVKYIKEAKSMGIDVLPPNINKSYEEFRPENNNIRFGLSAVKNVGKNNISEIISERSKNGHFKSFEDFIKRAKPNKKIIESLTLCGALDDIIPNRATIINNIDKIVNYSSSLSKDSDSSNLFESDTILLNLKKIDEFKENELLKYEKESTGIYITGHLLSIHEEKINAYSTKTTAELKEIKFSIENGEIGIEIPQFVEIAGIIEDIEYKKTKKDQKMVLGVFEDLEGEIKFVIFPNKLEEIKDKLRKDIVLIKGKPDFDKEPQIIVDDIVPLDSLPDKKKTKIINIKLKEDKINYEEINKLKSFIKRNPGNNPIIFHLYDLENKRKVNIRVSDEFCIPNEPHIIDNIKKFFFVEDIWVNGS